MTRRVLIVRLDSMGDVLVSGPAVRAVAATGAEVVLLAGPDGAAAARLLPGVAEVLVWNCPWIVADPPPVEAAELAAVADRVRSLDCAEALVLTSFHQSALPTALLLRLAGIGRIAACSTDYPGALLDLRIAEPADAPEPVRMLRIAEAAGYRLPPGDLGDLRVRLAPVELPPLPAGYLVLHPGAAAPARTCSPDHWATLGRALVEAGWPLALTGSAAEAGLTADLASRLGAASGVLDLAGRLDLPQLAGLLAGAAAVVVGNTGPAHLAAAVGAPVLSLFAPVVPASRWAPFTNRLALLGDQHASCAGSRARQCPVVGHPCLDRVTGDQLLTALAGLVSAPPATSTVTSTLTSALREAV